MSHESQLAAVTVGQATRGSHRDVLGIALRPRHDLWPLGLPTGNK